MCARVFMFMLEPSFFFSRLCTTVVEVAELAGPIEARERSDCTHTGDLVVKSCTLDKKPKYNNQTNTSALALFALFIPNTRNFFFSPFSSSSLFFFFSQFPHYV